MDIEEMNKETMFASLLDKLESMDEERVNSFDKHQLYQGWKRTLELVLSDDDVAGGLVTQAMKELVEEREQELHDAWETIIESYKEPVNKHVFDPPGGWKVWEKFLKRIDVGDRELQVEPTSERCLYDIAYRGRCNEPTVDDSSYCQEHVKLECHKKDCDQQPVRECSFAGQFVCGAPICPEHGCKMGHGP